MVIHAVDSIPTGVTFFAGYLFVERLRQQGFEVIDLFNLLNHRLGYQTAQLFTPTDFIIYLGHGGINKLYGDLTFGMFVPLIDTSVLELIEDKIVITIACLTGKELGPAAKYHAKCYTGSTNYMYIALNHPENAYMNDFIETWWALVSALVDGKTVQEAVEQYKRVCSGFIDEYRRRKSDWDMADTYEYYLRQNRDCYNIYGDKRATL